MEYILYILFGDKDPYVANFVVRDDEDPIKKGGEVIPPEYRDKPVHYAVNPSAAGRLAAGNCRRYNRKRSNG